LRVKILQQGFLLTFVNLENGEWIRSYEGELKLLEKLPGKTARGFETRMADDPLCYEPGQLYLSHSPV